MTNQSVATTMIWVNISLNDDKNGVVGIFLQLIGFDRWVPLLNFYRKHFERNLVSKGSVCLCLFTFINDIHAYLSCMMFISHLRSFTHIKGMWFKNKKKIDSNIRSSWQPLKLLTSYNHLNPIIFKFMFYTQIYIMICFTCVNNSYTVLCNCFMLITLAENTDDSKICNQWIRVLSTCTCASYRPSLHFLRNPTNLILCPKSHLVE